MITDSLTATMTEIPAGSQRDSKLWELAKSLESTFLEEMLSQTGLESSSAFGGGHTGSYGCVGAAGRWALCRGIS